MRRICIFTGSRADYSRIRPVIKAIENNPNLHLDVVVGGTHLIERHGKTIDEIVSDKIKISAQVFSIVEGETLISMCKSVGFTISELATAYQKLSPHIVVVHGDRFEAFAAAIAASMLNILIAHIQGGEVTGSIDESIRHAITKLSHFHFVSNEDSYNRVVRLGESSKFVYNVGCPMTDTILNETFFSKSAALDKKNKMNPNGFQYDITKPYLIAIYHPVTSEYGLNGKPVQNMLKAIDDLGVQAILLWPNGDAGAREVVGGIKLFLSERCLSKQIGVVDNLPSRLFLSLMKHADCIVGNSSSGIREACYFGTPVVNIGKRQDGRVKAMNIIDTEGEYKDIKAAILRQMKNGRYEIEKPYGNGTSSWKIAKILSEAILPSLQKKIQY